MVISTETIGIVITDEVDISWLRQLDEANINWKIAIKNKRPLFLGNTWNLYQIDKYHLYT